MKKLISMAVVIMMLACTTVTANAATTKNRVLVEGNEGRFWQTYLYGEYMRERAQ